MSQMAKDQVGGVKLGNYVDVWSNWVKNILTDMLGVMHLSMAQLKAYFLPQFISWPSNNEKLAPFFFFFKMIH